MQQVSTVCRVPLKSDLARMITLCCGMHGAEDSMGEFVTISVLYLSCELCGTA